MKIRNLVFAVLALFSSVAFSEPININTADVAVLVKLNGIGAKKAEAIVAYRKEHGAFKTVEDLSKVRGISPAFVDKNRSNLTVGSKQ